jgi:hypothetical protein
MGDSKLDSQLLPHPTMQPPIQAEHHAGVCPAQYIIAPLAQ